jgi:hypothetical protein
MLNCGNTETLNKLHVENVVSSLPKPFSVKTGQKIDGGAKGCCFPDILRANS